MHRHFDIMTSVFLPKNMIFWRDFIFYDFYVGVGLIEYTRTGCHFVMVVFSASYARSIAQEMRIPKLTLLSSLSEKLIKLQSKT